MQGVVTGGGITRTKGRTGVSLLMVALTGFVVLVIAAMAVIDIAEPEPAPLGCATGELTVVGSTAFEPVIREAARLYGQLCPGSALAFGFEGSERGMARLEEEAGGHGGLLAIGDAPKGADYDEVAAGGYPFWGVEYAFGHGDFALGSLGAGFLRFLAGETGQDVIRSYGNLPCADIADPALGHPRAWR